MFKQYINTFTDNLSKNSSDLILYGCGVEQCVNGYAYGPRAREYDMIHFIIKGEGFININGIHKKVKAGQAFVIPSNQISYYKASEENPWLYMWISFTGLKSDLYVKLLLESSKNTYLIDDFNLKFIQTEINKILSLEIQGLTAFLESNASLFHIMANLLSSKNIEDTTKNINTYATKIRNYIDKNYDTDIKISDIAKIYGFHPNYLCYLFKKEFEISPKKYLTNLRIKRACNLLKNTDYSINIIANSIGFQDQLKFSKTFHKLVGMSPSKYRSS